ncbi:hypothetical protein ACHAXN_008121 [Cyclotella atomus]
MALSRLDSSFPAAAASSKETRRGRNSTGLPGKTIPTSFLITRLDSWAVARPVVQCGGHNQLETRCGWMRLGFWLVECATIVLL